MSKYLREEDVVAAMCRELGATSVRAAIAIEKICNSIAPAEVAPVVCCRECRYAENTITGECKYCAYWGDMFQTFNKLYLKPDFFCAAGEKRKGTDVRGDGKNDG